MRNCQQQKGIVTLGVLLLLSSLLLILLSLDDIRLASYNFISWRYQYSFQEHFKLQQQALKKADTKCQSLSLNQSEDILPLIFKSEAKKDPLTYKIWCERKKLFKQQPTKSQYAGQLSNYINLDVLNIFKPRLLNTTKLIQRNASPQLYLVRKEQNTLTLEGEHYGIILTEGDLHLIGEGKLYGSVLTQGTLHTANKVKLIYKKNVVLTLMEKYRYWQKAENSLYDLN